MDFVNTTSLNISLNWLIIRDKVNPVDGSYFSYILKRNGSSYFVKHAFQTFKLPRPEFFYPRFRTVKIKIATYYPDILNKCFYGKYLSDDQLIEKYSDLILMEVGQGFDDELMF